MTINELAAKLQNPPSNWWKWFGGIIAFVVLTAMAITLYLRTQHLAKVKTELAAEKLRAQQAAAAAELEANAERRKVLSAVAADAVARVEAKEKALTELAAEAETRRKQVAAVASEDWAALNALAGIKTTN